MLLPVTGPFLSMFVVEAKPNFILLKELDAGPVLP